MSQPWVLYGVQGVVEKIYLPNKAVLEFYNYNDSQKCLLWIENFVFNGANLDSSSSFDGKLEEGDHVYFDCQENKKSTEAYQWFSVKAWKYSGIEPPPKSTKKLFHKKGFLKEFEPGNGIIIFKHNGCEEKIYFFRSKLYLFGKKFGKGNIKNHFTIGDYLHFNAEECTPKKQNKMCFWEATCVWKGKCSETEVFSDEGEDESKSVRELSPSDGSLSNSSQDYFYKDYLTEGHKRENCSSVLGLINEKCGIALWLVSQNAWETVFFHRNVTYLDEICLKNFDLHESMTNGTVLSIIAVPAKDGFPCKWIAEKAVASTLTK